MITDDSDWSEDGQDEKANDDTQWKLDGLIDSINAFSRWDSSVEEMNIS